MSLHVGIDIGGTFTDAAAITAARSVHGKSLSTGDVTSVIFDSLAILQDGWDRQAAR
jgi:N-methylhydantoinase A